MVPILTTTSKVRCIHGGEVVLTTTNAVGTIEGAAALLTTDLHVVTGCPFAPGGVPTPCVLVRWAAGATQSSANGIALLLQTSVGVSYNAAQAPQGVAVIGETQQLALGV